MTDGYTESSPLGRLENITVRTADGRVFDLGHPGEPGFRTKVAKYIWARRKEFAKEPKALSEYLSLMNRKG